MIANTSELDERIEKCQKILDADPNSQIFAALADAYRKKGDLHLAIEICQNGIRRHPQYALAFVVLAKVYLEQQNFEEADRQLQRAISSGGRTRSVDLLQSEILMNLGQKKQARSILEKLCKSDPNNETIKKLINAIENLPDPSKMANPTIVKKEKVPAKQTDTPVIPKRKYTLSNALSIIKILPRVLGVVAVTEDGIVVEGHFDGMLSKEDLGAIASGVYQDIASNTAKIGLGKPREFMVESAETKLLVMNKKKFLIVIATRDDVNVGSLKLKINDIFNSTDY